MKRRRLIFFSLWIMSIVGISCYGGAVSYGFFFALTLVPVVSLCYLMLVYFRFRIYQKLESRNMVCGQPMPYYFVLQNDDYCAFAGVSVKMYSSFSYVENMPEDTEYELLPGDKFTYETKLVCKYRGEYEVGVKEIVVTDFFRLFRVNYRIPSPIKALALPRIVRVDNLNSISEITAFLQKESAMNRTEPDVLTRDYAAGDSIRQVHWLASAKEQKLKTRLRMGEEKQGISILCDTKRYDEEDKKYLPVENKILETLLALGIFFAEKGMNLTTYYGQNGVRRSQVEGVVGFEAFYREVSGISFDKSESPQDILNQLMGQGLIYESKMVICILHEINDSIMSAMERLSATGVFTVAYLVTDEDAEDYLRQSGERKRIIVIPVEARLEGIL